MTKKVKLKIKAKDLFVVDLQKFRYKKVRKIFESIFDGFLFREDAFFNIETYNIKNNKFILNVNLTDYFLKFDIFIKDDDFLIKNYINNLEKNKKNISKIELLDELNKIDFSKSFKLINQDGLEFKDFVKEKEFYFNLIEMYNL